MRLRGLEIHPKLNGCKFSAEVCAFLSPAALFSCMTLSLKALAKAPAYTLPIWAIGLMFACHPRLLDLSLPPWTSPSRARVPFTASLPGSCSLSSQHSAAPLVIWG